MLVYSDNNPKEFEFLQGSILVSWGVIKGEDPKDQHTTYTFQQVKIELTDTLDQIIQKLTDAGYTDNVTDFANKIIAFRDTK